MTVTMYKIAAWKWFCALNSWDDLESCHETWTHMVARP